ncbi:MAG: saccharopine dehydrogenase [Osedax symbiont Rs1]|nr:MAG: saccharopine dehydrogenase [Osedax symbiont Rs1]
MLTKILILGGYGNFGKRISQNLADIQGLTILLAGRDKARAQQTCDNLKQTGCSAQLQAAYIDIHSDNFVATLKSLAPQLVIHTGGPFQDQAYTVPAACIEIGSHYIDLADDRRYVCDITTLNEQAIAKDLLLVSGASTVPGLSSTVIDHFIDEFACIDEIDFAIAPGNQAERGKATVAAILKFTGQPFSTYNNGQWCTRYGWMSARKWSFGDTLGKRWLANINIPDLELFPKRYSGVQSVKFQAGLELPLLHLGMVSMALLAKIGLVKDWASYTDKIVAASDWFIGFGTDSGGMRIDIKGLDHQHQAKHIQWILSAKNGVGPYIPTLAAIILARKLINGEIGKRGATPCLGMFSLQEFDQQASLYHIHHQTLHNP